MIRQAIIPHPATVDAILEPGLISGDGLQSVRLIHPEGELLAWTWKHIQPANSDSVLTGTVQIQPFGYPLGSTSIIENIQWQPAMQVINLIPDSFGTTDGLVNRFRALVDLIHHPGLYQLIQDVFAIRAMFHDYWTATSCAEGKETSMAEQAIAATELVQWSAGLSSFQRSVGIVFALLRNAGHAWPTQHWPDGEHALHLLREIDGAMFHLAVDYPEDADVLRELMESEYRLTLSPLALSILEHVNQLSDSRWIDAYCSESDQQALPRPSNLVSLENFRRRRQAQLM